MKKLISVLFVLAALSFEMSAQYVRPEAQTAQIRDSYLTTTPVLYSYLDEQPVSPDLSKALSQKKTGTALLISAGACTAVGAVFFGLSWTLISDSIPDAARSIPIIGVSLLGVSAPLYVAGSVLYVKGKKASMEVTPAGLAIRF